MQTSEKKKLTYSGSRLKAKKIRADEFEHDTKVNHAAVNSTQHSKNKAGKSISQQSKQSRKNSIKRQKKHSKSTSNKERKDIRSHSVSADRKRSLKMKNKTQLNAENDEIQKHIFKVRMNLKKLRISKLLDSIHLQQYYQQLKACFDGAQHSLFLFFIELHNYYMTPLQPIFQILRKNQDLARRKQQISKQIDNQINTNQNLWGKMSAVDVQIFRMREKIEENRQKIQRYRKQKIEKELSKSSQEKNQSTPPQITLNRKLLKQFPSEQKGNPLGNMMKLDFTQIDKEKQVGYHEQFYANIQSFSESWRDQALREKRF